MMIYTILCDEKKEIEVFYVMVKVAKNRFFRKVGSNRVAKAFFRNLKEAHKQRYIGA
jgi:hypothetical protein